MCPAAAVPAAARRGRRRPNACAGTARQPSAACGRPPRLAGPAAPTAARPDQRVAVHVVAGGKRGGGPRPPRGAGMAGQDAGGGGGGGGGVGGLLLGAGTGREGAGGAVTCGLEGER